MFEFIRLTATPHWLFVRLQQNNGLIPLFALELNHPLNTFNFAPNDKTKRINAALSYHDLKSPKEIQFNAGDIMEVISLTNCSDYIVAKRHDKIGLVPLAYIEPIQN